jgi:hypothetical protein
MLYQTNVFLAVLGKSKAIHACTRRVRVDSERPGSFLFDCTSAIHSRQPDEEIWSRPGLAGYP